MAATTKRRRIRIRAARRAAQAAARNQQVREQNAEAAELAELVKRGVRTKPMLEVYFNRRQIDDGQYKAGMSLRGDWIGMGKALSPGRIKAQSLELLDGGGYNDSSPYQLDCKTRVDSALRAVGKVLASVLANVCFHDLAASEWAKAFGHRPDNDGIACLRAGLDGLRLHYDRDADQAWREWFEECICLEIPITHSNGGEISPLARTARVNLTFPARGADLRQPLSEASP